MRAFLRLFFIDGEPEDSAEIKARKEILQRRERNLRRKIALYRETN